MYNPFKKTYSKEEQSSFRFLARTPLFAPLTPSEMSEFLPFMYQRRYEKNEIIFFRGDPSQALYIVAKGQVALNLDIEDKFEELTRLKTGDMFGENALMKYTRRIYNAVCVSDHCELYAIPSANIFEIFEDDKKINAKMMTALGEYYEQYVARLFRAYKESFGFFDLGRAFMKR